MDLTKSPLWKASVVSVVASEDEAYTAVFEEDSNPPGTGTEKYTLNVSSDENGKVNEVSGEYEVAAEIEIIATPNEGYQFAGWTGYEDVKDEEATFTFTMPGKNVGLVANFELIPEQGPEEYTLSVVACKGCDDEECAAYTNALGISKSGGTVLDDLNGEYTAGRY